VFEHVLTRPLALPAAPRSATKNAAARVEQRRAWSAIGTAHPSTSTEQIGEEPGLPRPLPHHRTCGSASGGSRYFAKAAVGVGEPVQAVVEPSR